ncbi:MAG: DEAD/DEAH box helicase [Akkermansia sp.]|nr:DEAD/DEAH box helicase [Akkermansia sp.]
MKNNIDEIQLDDCQQTAFNKIKDNPNQNFFIQGQAGTGKSTLINYIRKHLRREVAVVAPTGIAAQLIEGATIHSMFKLGGKPYFPLNVVNRYKKYEAVVGVINTLIIDEASMLRADIFDTINCLCKKAQRDYKSAFGGIQIVLVGDLCQLPPVYKYEDEKAINYMMKTYGVAKPFFFDAKCYEKGKFQILKLNNVHRQNADMEFLKSLRTVSSLNSEIDSPALEDAIRFFNDECYDSSAKEGDIITITAKNEEAAEINERQLANLAGEERAPYFGTFCGEYYNPKKYGNSNVIDKELQKKRKEGVVVPEVLKLKVGAKVIICRNDAENGEYVNGTIGNVSELNDDSIKVEKADGNVVELRRVDWYQQEYVKKTDGSLELSTIGTYNQFPLKLAYAISIHKSQGQTLEDVRVDLGDDGAFEAGQTYVALSRAKTRKGVHLVRKITLNDIIANPRVREFLSTGKKPRTHIAEDVVAFWKQYYKIDTSIIHHANLSVNWDTKGNVTWQNDHFWFTLDYRILNSTFYLVCIDGVKCISYLFRVPGGKFTRNHFGLDVNKNSNDNRHNDNPQIKAEFCANHFDIYMKYSDEYAELYMNMVKFQPYLIAKEINWQVKCFEHGQK